MQDRPLSEEDLSAWLDGELSAERAAAVASWLATSDEAARTFRRLNGVRSLLRRWDADEVGHAHSVAFRRRVMGAVTGGVAQPSPGRMRGARLATASTVALAASLVVAVGALAYGLVVDGRTRRVQGTVDTLERQVRTLSAEVQVASALDYEPSSSALPEVWEPLDLAPLGEIVSRDGIEEDFGVLTEGLSNPTRVYERHGDTLILRQAFEAKERFVHARRMTRLHERQRELIAATDGADAAGESSTTDAGPPARLASWLGSLGLRTDDLPHHEHMQVWPITGASGLRAGAPAPRTLEDALKRRRLRVIDSTEGSVTVKNVDRERPVLLLTGDLLSGGRRDRVIAQDALVQPEDEVTVAVREDGPRRPRPRSRYSEGMATAEIRSRLVVDPRAVEFDRAAKRALVSLVATDASRLDEVYDKHMLLPRVDRIVRRFESRLQRDDVVGFAFSAGPRILGIEVFGSPELLAEVRSQVLRSYVLEAWSMTYDERQGTRPGPDAVRDVLSRARRGVHEELAGVGRNVVGSLVSVDDTLVGHGLFDGHGPVHALVVPRPAPLPEPAPDSPVGGALSRETPPAPDGAPPDRGPESGSERGSSSSGTGLDSR